VCGISAQRDFEKTSLAMVGSFFKELSGSPHFCLNLCFRKHIFFQGAAVKSQFLGRGTFVKEEKMFSEGRY
jgi:hypothetical protein